jgi:gluconate 2-dehydrogenase
MSERQRVWVSRPVFPEIVTRLEEHFDVIAETVDARRSVEQLKTRLADVDGAMLGGSDQINAAVLEDNKRLKVVANLGVGYNNLDIAALNHAGVLACNTPDVLDESVADYAWALMLAAARRVGAAERWLRAGQWKGMRFDDWLGVDVHGKTLGILGMGRIGQAIARRGSGFGMPVIYHNRRRLSADVEQYCNARYVEKSVLLGESDHLILVLPYTSENRHAIGASELALMKPSAVLVNIARGGIVDDAALAAALRDGGLAAAGLDVFEGEPSVHPDLLALENVVLSPHLGSATEETRRAMATLAADNLIAALGCGPRAGHPLTPINPEVLSSEMHSGGVRSK